MNLAKINNWWERVWELMKRFGSRVWDYLIELFHHTKARATEVTSKAPLTVKEICSVETLQEIGGGIMSAAVADAMFSTAAKFKAGVSNDTPVSWKKPKTWVNVLPRKIFRLSSVQKAGKYMAKSSVNTVLNKYLRKVGVPISVRLFNS